MQTVTTRGLSLGSTIKFVYYALAIPLLLMGIGAGIAAYLGTNADEPATVFMILVNIPLALIGAVLGILELMTGHVQTFQGLDETLIFGWKGLLLAIGCGIADALILAVLLGLFFALGIRLWTLFCRITLSFKE
jgi:hypothetical protein